MKLTNLITGLGLKLKKRHQHFGVILLYHRVHDEPVDPQLLAVKNENFSKQMQVLRNEYNPISIQGMLEQLALDTLEEKSVAVTFDDGYADNFLNALPVLEQYNIPATIYLAIDHVIDNRPFWWDMLEQIFLLDNELPRDLTVRINGASYSWQDIEQSNRPCEWNVLESAYPGQRYRVYSELANKMHRLGPEARESVENQLVAWSGVTVKNDRHYRLLARNEIHKLASNRLIDIGAHTCSHVLLSSMQENEQRQEIEQSKAKIEQLTGKSLQAFAYPYGYKGSYNRKSVAIVQQAGFRHACSNFNGLVFNDTNKFTLPRVLIRNMEIDSFSLSLRSLFS